MIRRHVYQDRRVYVLVCDRCSTAHMPPAPPEFASHARKAAQPDGWQASRSKKHRGRPDLCPECGESSREAAGVTG